MDEKQMTICQCCEYLDTMVGDNPEVKECIDYIQERAEAMSRKLMEYKEKQVPINSAEFKHFKLHSDSTLKRLTKDDLINYIHALYHNWKESDERAEHIKAHAEILHEKSEIPKKVIELGKKEQGYTHVCPRCGQFVGTVALERYDNGYQPAYIEEDEYCCSCGQRLDWSGNE